MGNGRFHQTSAKIPVFKIANQAVCGVSSLPKTRGALMIYPKRSTKLTLQERFQATIVAVFFGAIMIVIFTYWPRIKTFFPRYHEPRTNSLSSELIWSLEFRRPISMEPVANDSIVVVLQDGQTLTALDNLSGQVVWEFTTPERMDVGATSRHVFDVNEAFVIFSTANQELIALSSENGVKIWQTALQFPVDSTPNIRIINDAIIVVAKNFINSGHVAIYQINDGSLIWEADFPPKSYAHSIECPSVPTNEGIIEQAICLVMSDKILIVNSDTSLPPTANRISEMNEPFQHYPGFESFYKDGMIFTSPNPYRSVFVFDMFQSIEFPLPAHCTRKQRAQPARSVGEEILIVNGCNEIYTLNIEQLDESPNWIFESADDLATGMISLDGNSGYVLTDRGEILEISLSDGEEIGSFTTRPSRLKDDDLANSLVANAPYFYAVMDQNTLFVFKEAE